MRVEELKKIVAEFEVPDYVTCTVAPYDSKAIEMRLSYLRDGEKYFVAMHVREDRDSVGVRCEVEMCFELMREAIAEGKPCA